MIKRFFRRLFGLPTPDEKTAFDAAVDDLNKTIEQLDRDIHIIRSASEEGMKRQEKLDHDWEEFKKKLPTDNHENQDP